MGLRIQRVGDRILSIGSGMQIITPRSAAAAGWWEVAGKTCVAAYQPKGAASYAASLVNLANPGTYDATEGVAPDWATGTGWSFNGIDDWLNSNVPANACQTYIVQYTDLVATAAARYIFGTSGGWTHRTSIEVHNTAVRYLHGGQVDVAPSLAAGNLGISGQQGYRNGTAEGGSCGTGVANADVMYIGCFNASGPANFHQVVVVALAFYVEALTAAEMATLATAMAAL